jgi:dihydroneopterin aldolase
MDKIIISGLRIFAYHGVNPEEKENGQPFVIDFPAELDLSVPCATDDVNDTVSYAKIIKTINACFTAEKYDLLERAAEVVCQTVLKQYKKIKAVEITLKKPEAPIKASFSWVGVSFRRERDV